LNLVRQSMEVTEEESKSIELLRDKEARRLKKQCLMQNRTFDEPIVTMTGFSPIFTVVCRMLFESDEAYAAEKERRRLLRTEREEDEAACVEQVTIPPRKMINMRNFVCRCIGQEVVDVQLDAESDEQPRNIGTRSLGEQDSASLNEPVSRKPDMTKNVRQQTSTSEMGRSDNSRFRNKNLDFTEEDVVQMKVFTPIMKLVIKTTYDTDKAYQDALETRRRGLKLRRDEEEQQGLNFTIHVTQSHINLVAKALNQLSQEEPTTTRSLNMGKQTTNKQGEKSRACNQSSSTKTNDEATKYPPRVGQQVNLRSIGEDGSPTNRNEAEEPVVQEKKKLKRQDGAWTEGPKLADSGFLKSRIHQLNCMVNKVCGDLKIVRTQPVTKQEDDEEVIPENVDDKVIELNLDSLRVQQLCNFVNGILHPDNHKIRSMDDDVCTRECEHPRTFFVHINENGVEVTNHLGPDSGELLQATELVFQALHNTTDMGERKQYESEGAEKTFVQAGEMIARVRDFNRLVCKTLNTESNIRGTSKPDRGI